MRKQYLKATTTDLILKILCFWLKETAAASEQTYIFIHKMKTEND